ncbi:MAG: transposase [Planctomycetota bacterium]
MKELRDRDLSNHSWVAVIRDCIRLSSDQVVGVAVGIDATGANHVLDFSLGCTENLKMAKGIACSIHDARIFMRASFVCYSRCLRCLAVCGEEHFPDSEVQRCLVHKERNITGKLSRRLWCELNRLFRRSRSVQSFESASEVVEDLKRFLDPINAEAYRSLLEAGEDLLALHRLNVPNCYAVNC